MVATNITFWDVIPRSGSLPLTITFDGFLFRNDIQENQSDSAIVDGETVWLQQFDPNDDQWKNVLSVTTSFDSSRGFHGHIYGTASFSQYTVPGDYQVRLHYGGNSAKNLTGCE